MKLNGIDREAAWEGAPDELNESKSRRMRRGAGRTALWLLALLLVAAAAVWAYRANVASDRPAMDMAMRVTAGDTPFPVTLAPVERGPVRGGVTYTGSVAPLNEEDIYPRVTGRIVEIPVYPGDPVRPGQVVARLDDVELGSRVQEAAAGTTAAEANLAQMEADVTAARHGVAQMERELTMAAADVTAARKGVVQMEGELAMAEAEVEHQELFTAQEERLFRSGATSRHDVENQRAMVASARAKVQAARAKIEQGQAMVASAEARADAARAKAEQAKAMETSALRKRDAMTAMAAQSRAQLRTAEVVRGYVTIVAPSAGYVVKRLVAPGVLVQPGMAILKIAQIDRVRLQANVGERDLASIKVGSAVSVATTGDVQPPLAARVTSVFPFVDPGARTAVVEAVVENTGRRFLPGQYVAMQFVTGERPDALGVPRGAVSRMGQKAVVWVVADGKVEPREVTTGLENPERVEITRGLNGDERVVVRGHEGLYAGARVAEASPATAGSAPEPADTPHGGHGAHGAAPAPVPAPPPPPAAPHAHGNEASHGTH